MCIPILSSWRLAYLPASLHCPDHSLCGPCIFAASGSSPPLASSFLPPLLSCVPVSELAGLLLTEAYSHSQGLRFYLHRRLSQDPTQNTALHVAFISPQGSNLFLMYILIGARAWPNLLQRNKAIPVTYQAEVPRRILVGQFSAKP